MRWLTIILLLINSHHLLAGTDGLFIEDEKFSVALASSNESDIALLNDGEWYRLVVFKGVDSISPTIVRIGRSENSRKVFYKEWVKRHLVEKEFRLTEIEWKAFLQKVTESDFWNTTSFLQRQFGSTILPCEIKGSADQFCLVRNLHGGAWVFEANVEGLIHRTDERLPHGKLVVLGEFMLQKYAQNK